MSQAPNIIHFQPLYSRIRDILSKFFQIWIESSVCDFFSDWVGRVGHVAEGVGVGCVGRATEGVGIGKAPDLESDCVAEVAGAVNGA